MENMFMPVAPLYYVLVVIITGAVLVNTVVGIFVENYEVAVQEREAKRERFVVLLTQIESFRTFLSFILLHVLFVLCTYRERKEAQPIDLKHLLHPDEVFRNPKVGFRKPLYVLVQSKPFEMLIAFFIIANTISMSFDSWKASSWQLFFNDW